MSTPTTQAPLERAAAMRRWNDPFPRLLDWFDTLVPGEFGWRTGYTHSIRVEEYTHNGNFVVRAELPGIDPAKDVDITVGDGLLTISGERKERVETMHRSELFYGKFTRTIALPTGANEKSVNAEYRDGILEVRIMMPTTKPEVTHIPVGRG